MAGPSAEGVIQFAVDHETRMLEERVFGEMALVLAAWRELLARLGLIGRDPSRYQGAGYGNVSARVGPFGDVGRGQRRFLYHGHATKVGHGETERHGRSSSEHGGGRGSQGAVHRSGGPDAGATPVAHPRATPSGPSHGRRRKVKMADRRSRRKM